MLALLRDSFHATARRRGETARRRQRGARYPITILSGGVRRAAALGDPFAAGAKKVITVHEQARATQMVKPGRLESLAMTPQLARVVSAHVMGGCGMSGDARMGVTDSSGRHRQLANVTICDGSLFPTSVGANPQLSIYGLAARNASRLAEELTGRPAPAIN